jgi:hypothetical protein
MENHSGSYQQEKTRQEGKEGKSKRNKTILLQIVPRESHDASYKGISGKRATAANEQHKPHDVSSELTGNQVNLITVSNLVVVY